MRTIIYREEARAMADAHAEHEGLKRDGCPECEGRDLRSYPSLAALLRVSYTVDHLSVSTDHNPRRRSTARWAVYYRGRLLHGGLSSSSEADTVRGWYAEGVSPDDPRWKLISSEGKKPSPSTDDIRKAMR